MTGTENLSKLSVLCSCTRLHSDSVQNNESYRFVLVLVAVLDAVSLDVPCLTPPVSSEVRFRGAVN
jgi:hypothetical protein